MAEPGDILHSDDEPPEKQTPWGVVAAVVIFIGLAVFAVWATHHRKNEESRAAVIKILDQELVLAEEGLKAQRDKVKDLTERVEALRAQIHMGQAKNKKAAVEEFNKLAAEQRAEREVFAKMAEEYNQKVAKFRALQE